jgi:hypothetical protein
MSNDYTLIIATPTPSQSSPMLRQCSYNHHKFIIQYSLELFSQKSFRFQKLFLYICAVKKKYETNSAEVRDKIFTRGT